MHTSGAELLGSVTIVLGKAGGPQSDSYTEWCSTITGPPLYFQKHDKCFHPISVAWIFIRQTFLPGQPSRLLPD